MTAAIGTTCPAAPIGIYRQDYFHNRLCVRPEKIWMGQKAGESRYSVREAVPGQGILEFLRDAGSYRKVRTQKVDFLSLPDIDYSRSRVIDDNWGYALGPGHRLRQRGRPFRRLRHLQVAQRRILHPGQLVAHAEDRGAGEHWYDTVYDAIAGYGGTPGPPLPQDKRLLIVFPSTAFKIEGVEPQKRHYQDELTIHQTTGQHFELRETVGFVTVLIPHAAGADPKALAAGVKLLPVDAARAGQAVGIEVGGKTYLIGPRKTTCGRTWPGTTSARNTPTKPGKCASAISRRTAIFSSPRSDGAKLSLYHRQSDQSAI